jgi:hypothetical protein
MKPHTRKAQFCMLTLAILVGGLLFPAEAQKAPPSAVACNFVGRFYLNPISLQGEVVGYFTNIRGIFDGMSTPLFNGTPSERTAFFSHSKGKTTISAKSCRAGSHCLRPSATRHYRKLLIIQLCSPLLEPASQ